MQQVSESRTKGFVRSSPSTAFDQYLHDIQKLPLITDPAEERRLARLAQKGDEAAAERLVTANLRFVISYVKKYQGHGLDLSELVAIGNEGLLKAVRKFDPDQGVKFISYAVWWVRQAIFHALSQGARAFSMPQKLSGQVSRVGNARQKLAAELERQPTAEEVAEKTDMSEREVESILRMSGEDLSLSTALSEDGNLELGDTLEQEIIPPVELELIREGFRNQIRGMVSELDDKERQVIRMRFGLDGEEPRTLQEIGEALKLSRERIRQIESKAKEKLRRNQKSHGLRGYLN